MSQSDFVTRGQALVSSGQFQEAVKVCRLGLLGRPTTVEGRVVLGQALLALKRYDEVLAEMRVALELDHASVAAQALKAEALLCKGDGHGALEILAKLRSEGLADAHAAELLADAERLVGRSPPGNAGHAAVGFVSEDPAAYGIDHGTKNYPAHLVDNPGGGEGNRDGGGEYTRPTSLAPGPRKRAEESAIAPVEATPPPAVLAVGDRSGTLEVDPDVDGLEINVDDDFGDVVGPPVADSRADFEGATAQRGAVKAPTASAKSFAVAAAVAATKPRRAAMFKDDASSVELEDDEMFDIGESPPTEVRGRGGSRRPPGPGTAVRNAVKLPSGPIDQASPSTIRSMAPPQPVQVPPPHLAQLIASQAHVMNVQPSIQSRSAIVAALPTAAAIPMPSPPGLAPMPIAPQPQMQPPQMQPNLPPQMQPNLPPQMQPNLPPQMQPNLSPQMQPNLPPQMRPHLPLPMQAQQSSQVQPPQPSQMQPNLPPQLQPTMPPAPQLQATLPEMQHPQHIPLATHMQSALAAARPTIALDTGPQPGAGGDGRYNGQEVQGPAWARATMIPGRAAVYGAGRAGADEPTRKPHEIDPQIAAMLAGQGSGGVPAAALAGDPSRSQSRSTRRGRSRLQIAVWVMIGALVIGGGVFAGFQIRALRLHKQIAAARDRAVDLAKGDTWQGWLGARDSLYSIAQASPTVDNRAALARARGVLAFEFGDGLADARAAIDQLAGQSNSDLDLAIAYVALAQSDVKLAREAAERAQQSASDDPAARYVAGQAALLAGDAQGAIADLRGALDREARPLYAVGLARALGATSAWDAALVAVDRAADNPAGVIAKTALLAAAGRLTGGPGSEVRAQLGKIIAEGQKPPGDQTRGVAPAQVAFADLALAQVEFARNEPEAARAAYRASLDYNLNDQRFAEEFSDTLYAIGELETARKAATRALELWPASRRARTTLAQVWLALGKPAAALELFTKARDAASWPKGQTVRGQARLATGDVDGARADFDAAVKKSPGFEPALIARAWLDLASGDIAEAKQRIEGKFNPKGATTAMVAVYAAILRETGDTAARDRAKTLLERAVAGAPSIDSARAQLELARIYRDLGDVRGAQAAYAEASRTGNFDARLESGLLQIEDHDPRGGRATLEQLFKDSGEHPPAILLLELARARMLVGDHSGAAQLLALAGKAPGVPAWQLARERGRLALRKGDTAGAAQALSLAFDDCGSDLDTFILAADTISTDDKQAALAQKLKGLIAGRLKGRPEIQIIEGKLDLAAGRRDDAEKAYKIAHDALVAEKASSRRLAQADYGRAAVAYFKEDDPTATSMLDLVVFEDPSIYPAYLFAAEIARPKNPRKALELAQQAAALNPDWLDAWKLVGTLAAQLNNRKLLNDAILRVSEIAPGSETLRQLRALR